jgi:hypothetical protein
MRNSTWNLLLHCWLYKILGLVPEASERLADCIREDDKLQSEEIGIINSSVSSSMKETQISLTSGPRRAFRTFDREGVRRRRGSSDLAGSRFENRDG